MGMGVGAGGGEGDHSRVIWLIVNFFCWDGQRGERERQAGEEGGYGKEEKVEREEEKEKSLYEGLGRMMTQGEGRDGEEMG